MCIVFFIIVHELGHAVILHKYNIAFKFRLWILVTYVEFESSNYSKIKNLKLFYSAGVISTLITSCILLFISYLFGIDSKYGLYGISVAILNILLIYPTSDFYYVFGIKNKIKLNELNIVVWGIFGMITTTICCGWSIYYILFK